MAKSSAIATVRGTDRIVVRSTNAPMKRCEIYSASGTLVDRANGESTEYRLRPTSGMNIIKVYPEGKEPKGIQGVVLLNTMLKNRM